MKVEASWVELEHFYYCRDLQFRNFHRKISVLESRFNKVSVFNLQLYQKRDSGTGVFLRIFEKLLRAPFYRTPSRSRRPEVLCKEGVLRNFAKFTGNTCARVSFLIKLQAEEVCNFIKKGTLAQAFSCEFSEISKNTVS